MATAEKEKLSPSERAEAHASKIADLLIEQLKAGAAPWQRPWDLSGNDGLPINATTNKAYHGSNALYLWALQIQNGYTDNRWLTYRQAEGLGAQVRKGERGVQICYPATAYEVIKRDEHGKPVIGADGKPEKAYVMYEQPRMKYYTVFHASQLDNMPPQPAREIMHEWERHERAEAILRESKAIIQHGGDRAFYRPAEDRIQLPPREQFPSGDKYYATALHELTHWTGHESRLNREGITDATAFGTERYAREELVAEIGSLMIGSDSELQIGHDPSSHATYVGEWIKILQDDPKEILRACSAAGKVREYVLAFDPNRQIEHAAEHTIERAQTQEVQAERATPYNDRLANRVRAVESGSRLREQQRAKESEQGISHGL